MSRARRDKQSRRDPRQEAREERPRQEADGRKGPKETREARPERRGDGAHETHDLRYDHEPLDLDVLAQSFIDRCRSGEKPSIEEYIQGHPEHAEQIRQVFPTLLLLEIAGSESGSGPGSDAGKRPATPAPPVAPPSSGAAKPQPPLQRVGRYEVMRELDEGGTGAVYLGRDPDLGRLVVLKTVRATLASDPGALERLKREARLAGMLDHPGICPVLDVVAAGGREFVVLPFIDGELLSRRIQRARERSREDLLGRPFWPTVEGEALASGDEWSGWTSPAARGPGALGDATPRDRGDLPGLLRLMERVALSVHRAHEDNIVHGDLKPANIMVRPNGEPVVLDFGLAPTATERLRLGEVGDVPGTPFYMAPEQVEGKLGGIDLRTDVHALGVVLYELLTLKTPHEGATNPAIFRRILGGEPSPPRKLNEAIPRDLEAVCLMAMACEPERRYPTALAFAEDLRRVRTLMPTVAKPPSTPGRIWRRARRKPGLSVALAGLVLMAGAAGTLLVNEFRHRNVTSHYDRAMKVLLAISREEVPDPGDLDTLALLLPDDGARDRFLRNPHSRAEWERIELELRDRTRGQSTGGSPWRLLEPRAAITIRRPSFRFEVPSPGGMEWRFIITVSSAGLRDRAIPVTQGPGDDGPLAATLTEGPALFLNREYTWRVRLDEERHAEYAGRYTPEPATFRVLSPDMRRRVETSIPEAGRPAAEALLRAAIFLSRDLADDALAVLKDLPAGASAVERGQALILRAEAYAILDDRDAIDNMRREAEKVEATAAPLE